MQGKNKYAVMGLKALQRVAKKIAEDARRNNYKIPVWNHGRIEYKIPDGGTDPASAGDARTSLT